MQKLKRSFFQFSSGLASSQSNEDKRFCQGIYFTIKKKQYIKIKTLFNFFFDLDSTVESLKSGNNLSASSNVQSKEVNNSELHQNNNNNVFDIRTGKLNKKINNNFEIIYTFKLYISKVNSLIIIL